MIKTINNYLVRAAMTLLAVLFCLTGARANELTVNDGTNSSNSVPVYGTWCDAYLKCEFVIPASQLSEMENGIISKMSFYLNSPASAAWTGTFKVFLKEVGETTLSEYSGLANATVVYEGTLDATGNTMDVVFNNNFTYDDGNLLVGVYQIVNGKYSGASFYGIKATAASIYGYDSSNIESVTATKVDFLPKTTFTYTPGPAPAVEKPTDLVVSNLAAFQTTVNWTSAEAAWNLRYKEADAADWTTVNNLTAKTYTIEGLAASTTYSVQVQAVKGNETSKWSKETSFTTALGVPYRQAFTNVLPTGWKHYSGKLADVQAGSATLIEASLGGDNTWYIYGNASISLSGKWARHWLVTPAVTLGQASNLSFDLWMTGSYSSYDPSDDGIDDKFVVLASDDDGATWSVIATWDNAGSERVLNDLTKTPSSFKLDFPAAYAGKSVKVGFYAESAEQNANNRLYLNNVVFDDANRCIEPTELTATNVTSRAATVGWTSEGDKFNLQYKKAGDATWTLVSGITAKTYNLTGLTPTTDYTFRVQTDCGGSLSIWSEEGTFTTQFGIPFKEKFATSSRPTGWTSYSCLMSEVLGGTTNLNDLQQNTSAWGFYDGWAQTNLNTQFSKQWLITPDIIVDVASSQLTFDLRLNNYNGGGMVDQMGTDDQFAVLVTEDGGNTWTRLALWNNETARTFNSISNEGEQVAINLSAYEGKTIRLAFYAESTVANIENTIRVGNVLVDAMPAADVHRPQSLTVSSVTTTSATVTWAADAEVTGWNVQYRKRGSVIWYDGAPTGNACTFTVSAGNYYDVRVQAVSAAGTSGWSTVSFTTPFPESGCSISYSFKSTNQAKGWNSSSIKVIDTTTGIVVASLTLGAGKAEETGYLPLCNGRNYKFVWAPTEDYEGQASYYFYDVNGDEIFYKDEELRLGYSKLKEYTMDCTAVTCHQPTDLKATEVGFYSVTVSWTPGDEDQTSWELWYSGITSTPPASPTVTTVTTTTYTFENLYSDYTYYIYVRGVKGEEKSKWSRLLQIRTKNAKALPTDVEGDNETFYTTDVDWTVNGIETKWNLRYRKYDTYGSFTTINGITTHPYTLTGLETNTEYEVYVQPVYADNTTGSWSNRCWVCTLDAKAMPSDLEQFTATTTTATLTWTNNGAETKWNVRWRTAAKADELFLEDFEDGLDRWTVYTMGEAPQTNGWYAYDDNEAHSGYRVASAWSWYNDTKYNANNWLITPQIPLQGTIKFWVRTHKDYPDSYAVLLSTTGNAIEDFTVTLKPMDAGPATGEWTEVSIDLSEYTGQLGYIAIHHVSNDKNYLFIDDAGLYVNEVPAGEWQTTTVTEPTVALTGLTMGTMYDWQVQAVYDDGSTGDWTDPELFLTAPGILRGDVNNDLQVNAADIVYLVRYLKDGTMLRGFNIEAADADNSGQVDQEDVPAIKTIIMTLPQNE